MSEKNPLQEPDPNLEGKKYWDQTVGRVEDYLPRYYVAEVQDELAKAGIKDITDKEIVNCRNGRTRRRVLCNAFFQVGKRHYEQAQAEAV